MIAGIVILWTFPVLLWIMLLLSQRSKDELESSFLLVTIGPLAVGFTVMATVITVLATVVFIWGSSSG